MNVKLHKLNPHELKKNPKTRELEKHLISKLSAAERRKWAGAVKALDTSFLQEKAEVIIETVFEIYRNRKRTANKLLQRNLWGCLDSVAQHYDAAGFAPLFRTCVPKMLRGLSFTDPVVLDAEYSIISGVLGLPEKQASVNGIGRREFTAVMTLTEELIQKNGVGFLTRKDFSFLSASLRACGRPDGMLTTHKLPGFANLWKLIPVVVAGVVNWLSLPSVVIPVITIVVMVAIWFFGC